MKFLVDNALSPIVAACLNEAGYEASHVRDAGIQHAADDVIFDHAATNGAVVLSADTDFGTLLALRQESKPSVLLLRGRVASDPNSQAALVIANLPQVLEELASGAVVVIEPGRMRVRKLPIGDYYLPGPKP